MELLYLRFNISKKFLGNIFLLIIIFQVIHHPQEVQVVQPHRPQQP